MKLLDDNKDTEYGKKYDFVQECFSEKKYKAYSDEVLLFWNNELREKLRPYASTYLYNPNNVDDMIKSLYSIYEKNRI